MTEAKSPKKSFKNLAEEIKKDSKVQEAEEIKSTSTKSETVESEKDGQSSVTETTSTTTTQKKKSGCGWYLVLGCLALLLICCCSFCGLLFLAPSVLSKGLARTTKGRDNTLTRIDTNEFNAFNKAADQKFDDTKVKVRQDAQGQYEVTFTEKEVLAIFADALNVENNPDQIAVDLENNYMKLEVGIAAVIEAANDGSTSTGKVDSGLFEDMYFSTELSTSADGKELIVKNISTGNSFIDKLLPKNVETDLQKELNDSFKDASGNELKLQKINFGKDQVTFTYSEIGQ